MHEALYYTQLSDNSVRCVLCPWNCLLKPGQTGNCKVRENHDGKLITRVYNRVAAMAVDPVEKKPLYHFYPGKHILSIGETGCNLHCSFCQNYRISQCAASDFGHFQKISPEQIVNKALNTANNIGIAYTYNEPFTFFEFMADTAKLVQRHGLKNVVVSNGYVNSGPLEEALLWTDAFNIDLKSFSNEFYRKYTWGKLDPVKNTLLRIAHSQAHLEVTTLIIAGLNDDVAEFTGMIEWIAGELGEEVPLHISRYFPQYKMNFPSTPVSSLEMLYDIAAKHLHHVYTGNVNDKKRSTTCCPGCGEVLICRDNYITRTKNMNHSGHCTKCGRKVNIIC